MHLSMPVHSFCQICAYLSIKNFFSRSSLHYSGELCLLLPNVCSERTKFVLFALLPDSTSGLCDLPSSVVLAMGEGDLFLLGVKPPLLPLETDLVCLARFRGLGPGVAGLCLYCQSVCLLSCLLTRPMLGLPRDLQQTAK